MEEYLLYMKTLRSQMNDVEDQAAKISVEEQSQITTIQTLEKDLDLARSDIKQLKVETDQMVKAKGQICSQILEKHRKIASLESDSSTLSQTLELIQQERVSLSAKLVEKSTYYTKVTKDINAKLQEQQEWMNCELSSNVGQHGLMKDNNDEQTREAEGKCSVDNYLIAENVDDAVKNLMVKLYSSNAKLELVTQTKSRLVLETSKVKHSVELVKCRIRDLKPELHSMDVKTLEEERQALLSDITGETEYLHSLLQQFKKLMEISHVIKCTCGEEYKVDMDLGIA
ncbi:Protein NETWORKED 1D like [Actinidia chinensis var. chinensis]|uniref:Protein NETWORKED 1D like n=1 Tax=Actinidia chinensis var. chinensis TaxID=1590841 RepID=A0A2R6R291_ACTCC|nr:Protein NETWORKED 1D like [Actinidia chinensis var. chinensis]